MDELIEKIRDKFKGYHIEIQLYPAGGSISAEGCEECETEEKEGEISIWGLNMESKTFDKAVTRLKLKLDKKQ